MEEGPEDLLPPMEALHIGPAGKVAGDRPPILGRMGLHDAAQLSILLGRPLGRGRATFGFTCTSGQ